MIDSPLIILAGNSSYENRGCEAITRGTVHILEKTFRNPRFHAPTLLWNKSELNKQRSSEYDPNITHDFLFCPIRRFSIHRIPRLLYKIFGRHYSFMKTAPWKRELRASRAVLSVGGDNYSLDYGIPQIYTDMDDFVLAQKKPLIIWGASIGPFTKESKFEAYISEHLKKVTALFIRETASIEYLSRLGISQNVHRVADPAFMMIPIAPSPEKIRFPIYEGAVGLNISPLMANYISGGNKKQWVIMTSEIIQSLSRLLKRPLYLIPHVTIPLSNDYEHMLDALSHLEHQNDVFLVPPVFSAQETKWLIGKMSVFAGARTHATIAALSQGIPSLTFAYSIKGVGINYDIFQNNDYCIKSDMLTPGYIAEKLVDMLQRSAEIKTIIQNRLPEIQQMALSAGDRLRQIIGDVPSAP